MTTLDLVVFALVAALVMTGALWAVMARRAFHSALGLGVALIGVAGLFISMGSPFLGVMQILVYVGGILTLLVFAVMFVAGDDGDDELEARA